MRTVGTIAFAALLTGCGQKGPLILPDRHTHPAVEAPASAAAAPAPAPASAAPASAAETPTSGPPQP